MFDLLLKMKENNMAAIIHEETCISYKQLYQMICRNNKYLNSCGYSKEQCVIIQSKSQLEFVLSAFSVLSLGMWVIPINKEVDPQKVKNISDMTKARLMSDEESALCAEMSEIGVEDDIQPIDEKKNGIYHVTSGSTGTPKLCERSLYDFSLESDSFQQIWGFKSGTRMMSLCPLEHSFAAGSVLLNCFNFGGTLCIVEDFNPKKILKAIAEYSVEFLAMVPSMLRLFAKMQVKNEDVKSLKHALVGSGVMKEEVVVEFEDIYKCKVHSNYGSSESGCVITSRDRWKDKAAGVAMPDVTLKLCDEEYNVLTGENEVGQLYIKCEWMFSRYWGNDDVFTEDGFMTLGDIARIDSDGNVFILGRRENFVKVNGKKVNCLEVENKIKTLQFVTDCKVIGCKKRNNDEYIKAFLETKIVDQNEIRKAVNAVLEKHERPEKIDAVSCFPRNHMGKIVLEDLINKENIDS